MAHTGGGVGGDPLATVESKPDRIPSVLDEIQPMSSRMSLK